LHVTIIVCSDISQRLLICRYVGFTRSNAIMKWRVSTFPVVCFVSSEHISSGRARMRNADQTWCCTHMYRSLEPLLVFQQSTIAVVLCQHQTAIMNADSFSYLLFNSWSKENNQIYFCRQVLLLLNCICNENISIIRNFQRGYINEYLSTSFFYFYYTFIFYILMCYYIFLLYIYDNSNVFLFHFITILHFT